MTLVWIGNGLVQLAQDWSNDTQLANWVSIGMICYQGIHLRVSSSVISLYKGKQPRSRPWDEVVLHWQSICVEFSWQSICIQSAVNFAFNCRNWHLIDSQYAFNWQEMAFNWQSICIELKPNWLPNSIQLTVNWSLIGSQLAFSFHSIRRQLAVNGYSFGT